MPAQWTHRVGSLLFAATGLFLGLCLLTYTPTDIPLLSSTPNHPVMNLGGAVGAWVGFLSREGFGWASLLVPLLCFLWAWRLWQGGVPEMHTFPIIFSILSFMGSIATILAIGAVEKTAQVHLGGLCGFLFASSGRYYLGTTGTVLTALCIAVLSWLVVS